MKTNKLAVIELPERNIGNVFPYACLSCRGVDDESPQKIASVFSLAIIASHNSSVFFLTALQPQPGEHKAHTVTLLAAALMLHKIQPKVEMLLEVRRDFMAEEAPVHFSNFSESQGGPLKLSEACQIFLAHAGFHLTPQTGDIVLKPEQLDDFSHLFRVQAPRRLASGE